MPLTSSPPPLFFLHDSKDSETEAKSTHEECPPDRRETSQLAKKRKKEGPGEKRNVGTIGCFLAVTETDKCLSVNNRESAVSKQ